MARIQQGGDGALREPGQQAGGIQIVWGLEHIGERLSRFIGKPIDREQTLTIFRNCQAAGIKVLVQTLTGLPTETPEERDELFGFLQSQRDLFTSTPNLYLLAPKSEFYHNREVYRIEANVCEEDTFATGYHYTNRVPSAEVIRKRIDEYTGQELPSVPS